ncbi:Gag-asp_proteas domain-containing protein [Quillaja saponaria]|uniref:Gag-asp_proteas domain-containing protein n=1 Tax=Quillaja saponaria TaxID=32244 RepID=A0AAD7PYR9_QUISA|nr:Gag-asp_proteas domain-containing protein [Quillaja saponaria]
MMKGMTNQQKFDWIDSQLGELAGVSDSMIDIWASLKEFDIPGLIERVTTLERLVSRVRALERNKNVQGTGDNVAELEEQYFRAVRMDLEEAKVTTATMYLVGDAKLWWRTKYVDIQDGRCVIDSWEDLRRELKAQFFPENVEYIARRNLRELKQTGTIREYARAELQRQRVQDLATAQAAAECLTDYAPESSASKKPQQSSSGGNDRQFGKPGKNKSRGGDQRKPSYPSNSPQSSRGSVSTSKPRTISCFLCNGPHRVAECPQKTALNSLQASVRKAPQSHADEDEDEDDSDEDQPRMGALRFIGALKKHAESSKKSGNKGLMFVKGHLGGKPAMSVMLDTGATHNFVSEAEAKKLGLKLEMDSGRMKAVNSKSSPTARQAKQVSVKLMTWEGRVDFVVAKIDDFDVVLGMEFMLTHKAIPIPAASSLMIMGEQPAMVPAVIKQLGETQHISALQFKKGVKRQEPTFVAVPLVTEDQGDGEPVPPTIQGVLKEYERVMPDKLPQTLPPRRGIDHEIELVPGIKPPAKAP